MYCVVSYPGGTSVSRGIKTIYEPEVRKMWFHGYTKHSTPVKMCIVEDDQGMVHVVSAVMVDFDVVS